MKLCHFVIVLLLLVAKTIRVKSYLIKTPSRDEFTNSYVDDMVKIITSCYGDKLSAVGLAGDLPDTLTRKLSVENSIPVVLIDGTKGLSDTPPPVPLRFRQKLQLFIIGGTSSDQITAILRRNIKYSIWWNHMASYFILDTSENCVTALRYSFAAWWSNVLNAKVFCERHKSGRVLVAYNPFVSWAPVPWTKVYSQKVMHYPVFTWFARRYRGSERVCVNLDFDKTKNVSGTEIRVQGGHRDEMDFAKLGEWSTHFWMTQFTVLDTVLNVLNATAKFSGHETLRYEFSEDIFQIPHWLQASWTDYRLMSYPHDRTGLVLISHFRGHKSQLDKILCVIDFDSRIGLVIVYLITFVFFKFFVRQALMPALLNLVRITCDTAFANLPDNTASRLFLAGLLFFVVTMQGIYRGNLAALLTTTIPLRNINTLKDVIDLDYKTVYGSRTFKNIIDSPVLKERFVAIETVEGTIASAGCIEHVINDSSGVCIHFGQGTLDEARQAKLHVSKEFIEAIYTGFEVRHDWPLEQRVYDIIAKIVEADILKPWHLKCKPMTLAEFEFDDEVKKNKDFKNIEFAELRFGFVILGIGLVCAGIVFIIEVAIHRYKSRIENVRVHVLN